MGKEESMFLAAETIAQCDRCGRGFVTMPKPNARDPFCPLGTHRKDVPSAKPCGGRIIPVEDI